MLRKLINKTNLIFKNIFIYIENSRYIKTLLVFCFFLLTFGLVYMSLPTVSSADDHYFHIRFAQNLLNNGFLDSFRNFDSLYFTKITSGEHFIYYNFLFYIILIPFTFLAPLYFGIKLYAIFIVALIGTVLYEIFKNLGIKYAFVLSVLFFAVIGHSSLWRLFLSRPFVFAPIILLGIIMALHKKKYFLVSLLSFFYLFWHTATFFIPIVISCIYFIVSSLYSGKYKWKPVLYTILGTGVALFVVNVINIGFFTSINDNIITVIKNIALGSKVNIQEGTEIYKSNFFNYFSNNLILFLIYISVVIMQVLNYFKERRQILNLDSEIKNRRSLELTLFLFTSLIFLAIFNVSFRFSDTFIFFAWFYSIYYISGIAIKINISDAHILKSLKIVGLFLIMLLFLNNLISVHETFSESNRPATFEKVGQYISENLNKDEIIFNVDWSFFPQLYYYAPEQNYVIGLEPKLTYLYNKDMYWIWFNIRQGVICNTENCVNVLRLRDKAFRNEKLKTEYYKTEGDKIAIVVKSIFKSNYIVSSSSYEIINEMLDNNKNFEKVVDDQDYGVFLYKIK